MSSRSSRISAEMKPSVKAIIWSGGRSLKSPSACCTRVTGAHASRYERYTSPNRGRPTTKNTIAPIIWPCPIRCAEPLTSEVEDLLVQAPLVVVHVLDVLLDRVV